MKKFIIILIFVLFNVTVFANVILHAPNTFVKGEAYIFKFEVIGKSIEFPNFNKIDGFIVQDLGTSRSLQIINGNYTEKLSKTYKIEPTKDFIIPSFKFYIDGKENISQKKEVSQEEIKKTNSNYFELTLKSSNSEPYVGEDLIVTLVFKYKRGLQITNLGFEEPHFDNFWYKRVDSSNKKYEDNGYIVQELDFLLFPQKSGELNISPLKVDVEMVDIKNPSSNFGFFTNASKLEKIYSNNLKFNVKELPKGINLIGEFDINATVEKENIKEGEAVSYKLDIKGFGNFDDIQDFKLNINDATIYDNKPTIKTKYENNRYEGTYLKSYSIIPNKSIQIPSITLKYFSKKEKRVIEKKTKSFKIELENKKEEKVILEKAVIKPEIKKEVIVQKHIDNKSKITYFLLGALTSVLIFCLYNYIKIKKENKKNEDIPLVNIVKKTKSKEELLKTLLPYLKKDSLLDDLIYKCETKIDFKILKKEIINLLKNIKI